MFGIIQGRLTSSGGQLQCHPKEKWANEYDIASRLGFDRIELIVESDFNPDNPIWHDSEIQKLLILSKKTGVTSTTLCTDHILEAPLTDSDEQTAVKSLKMMRTLILQSAKAGIQKIVLPFLEKASTKKSVGTSERAITILNDLIQEASAKDIELLLENDLSVSDTKDFINACGGLIGVCYDTGNRISMGFTPHKEILELGSLIKHVHIKDKNDKKENVMLGQGSVDFVEVMRALKGIQYEGLLVLETCRGGGEEDAAAKNLSYLKKCMTKAGL